MAVKVKITEIKVLWNKKNYVKNERKKQPMKKKIEFDYMPKTGVLMRVKFRIGKDKVIGQRGRKICLITEIDNTMPYPKQDEVWLCRVVESFPNVIDIKPIEKIEYPIGKKQTEKPIEIIQKKRQRTTTQKVMIEKI